MANGVGEMLEELMLELQKMTSQSIIFSEAVARAAGLNSTDLEALGIIHAQENITAGKLAASTGLTTGATTALIDRLENAGFLSRENDPSDRRKVLLRLKLKPAEKIEKLYADFGKDMSKLIAEYTDDQKRMLIDFLRSSSQITAKHASILNSSHLNFGTNN